jgi:hypothetical protein
MTVDPKPGHNYLHSQVLLTAVRATYHTYWSAKYNCPLRSWVYASTSEHCLWDSPKSALKFWKWINQHYKCSHLQITWSCWFQRSKASILMTWLHWRHMVEDLLNIYSKLSIIYGWMFQVWTLGSYLLSHCIPSDFLLHSFRNAIHQTGNPSLIPTVSIISVLF